MEVLKASDKASWIFVRLSEDTADSRICNRDVVLISFVK